MSNSKAKEKGRVSEDSQLGSYRLSGTVRADGTGKFEPVNVVFEFDFSGLTIEDLKYYASQYLRISKQKALRAGNFSSENGEKKVSLDDWNEVAKQSKTKPVELKYKVGKIYSLALPSLKGKSAEEIKSILMSMGLEPSLIEKMLA